MNEDVKDLLSFTQQMLLLLLYVGSTLGKPQRCVKLDILEPYKHHFGPRHSHRVTRDCQPKKYGSLTHEQYPAHSGPSDTVVQSDYFIKKVGEWWDQKNVIGRYSVISDPLHTVSVVEPSGPGGCERHNRSTVRETSAVKKCIIAQNAGLFNTSSGECHGNIVTDGIVRQNSGGIQNAHFGIRKNGKLFFGYLTEEEVDEFEFEQLVGGVIWLVRNGQSYVNSSKYTECSDTEETGSIDTFVDVKSARTAVGHDKKGRIVLVNVEGQSWNYGINLWEFADLLIEFGVVNAINLDGGGSATAVINQTLVNYPSDECGNETAGYERFHCERPVSTILCAHHAPCHKPDCSHHGTCIAGQCRCDGYWTGRDCDKLYCPGHNCSIHGTCTKDGCSCNNGWLGEVCNMTCPPGFYGNNCAHRCHCVHGVCSPIDGSCQCSPGYRGLMCDTECESGYFGSGCRKICFCKDACTCHPVDGTCNVSIAGTALYSASSCTAQHIIKSKNLVPDQTPQLQSLLICVTVLGIIASISIILNIVLVYTFSPYYNSQCTSKCSQKQKYQQLPSNSYDTDTSDTCGEADDESDSMWPSNSKLIFKERLTKSETAPS
ncbi:unnamed protein product [Owenia fusiformis]|uniref:EGF-like domain-containing protein n=1 Tax=Owenia fusiformis TaxID=6347 RepID=A0A8S4NH62_OWEFU|nr:unnamed protein product [Owenia fusiformis]